MQTNIAKSAFRFYSASDECLRREVDALRAIQQAGGLERVCGVMPYDANYPPWAFMPTNGRRLNQIGSVLLPTDANRNVVVQYKVPIGYNGVVNELVFAFTGDNFVQGGGDLVWSFGINQSVISGVASGGYYAVGYGQVLFQIGSLQAAAPVAEGGGIRIYTNQLITLNVQRPNVGSDLLGPNTARVYTAMIGWIYPIQ